MKSSYRLSFPHQRRAVLAAVAAVLVGAASAVAQSPAANDTRYGTTQKDQSSDTSRDRATSSTPSTDANSTAQRNNQAQPTTATGSGYHSGTASADADAAREINAQNPFLSSLGDRDKLSWMDRRFVNNAADGGMAKVQLAKLATQHASNAEVKSFAQKIIDDHSKVNSELTNIAGQKNLKLDSEDEKDRTYKRLSKKSGTEFDQEFVEHMIDEHEKDIRMYERAAKDAKDSDIRSFASKQVDHLKSHLQAAQGLRQSVMPTGRMDDRSGRSSTPAGPTSIESSTTTPSSGDATRSDASSSSSSESTNRAKAPKR